LNTPASAQVVETGSHYDAQSTVGHLGILEKEKAPFKTEGCPTDQQSSGQSVS